MNLNYKKPVSVLVVVLTRQGDVLLLERSTHPGFWQSVTGSQEHQESLVTTARRELWEETGLTPNQGVLTDWAHTCRYEIFQCWRHRYPPDVTHNTEHLFSFYLPERQPIRLSEEHQAAVWCSPTEAAQRVFSASNREAIASLNVSLGALFASTRDPQ